jgi:hypothetical protein
VGPKESSNTPGIFLRLLKSSCRSEKIRYIDNTLWSPQVLSRFEFHVALFYLLGIANYESDQYLLCDQEKIP